MKISITVFCYSSDLSCHCLGWDFKYSQYEKGNMRQCSLSLPYSAWEHSQYLDLVRNPKYGCEIVSARTDCSCELGLMRLPVFRSCLPRPIIHTGILNARWKALQLLAVSLKAEFHQRMLFPSVCMFAIRSLWWLCKLPFVVAVSLVLK